MIGSALAIKASVPASYLCEIKGRHGSPVRYPPIDASQPRWGSRSMIWCRQMRRREGGTSWGTSPLRADTRKIRRWQLEAERVVLAKKIAVC